MGGANLVEVDLLRHGPPLVRLPKQVLEKIQPGGYVINVVCAEIPGLRVLPGGSAIAPAACGNSARAGSA